MNKDHRKRLLEIEAREKKATPGPWNSFVNISVANIRTGGGYKSKEGNVYHWCMNEDDEDNHKFIASARSDIPFLLSLVKELTDRRRLEAAVISEARKLINTDDDHVSAQRLVDALAALDSLEKGGRA